MMPIMHKNGGYIAVTSAIVISVILMVLIFTVSYTGYLNRFNILGTTSKQVSRFTAEACIAEARLKILQNVLYAGNETITVGNYECSIRQVENTIPGVQETIKAEATVNGAVTNLKVVISLLGLVVVSWEELENM